MCFQAWIAFLLSQAFGFLMCLKRDVRAPVEQVVAFVIDCNACVGSPLPTCKRNRATFRYFKISRKFIKVLLFVSCCTLQVTIYSRGGSTRIRPKSKFCSECFFEFPSDLLDQGIFRFSETKGFCFELFCDFLHYFKVNTTFCICSLRAVLRQVEWRLTVFLMPQW